jgi:hypothetical protein
MPSNRKLPEAMLLQRYCEGSCTPEESMDIDRGKRGSSVRAATMGHDDTA